MRSAVAALGTAFGAGHAKLLRRLCDRVVLLFDGDAAGEKAVTRALEVLLPEGLRVRAAQQTGDGIYRSQHGQVVVERAIAKTVLAPNMKAANAHLFEYRVRQ